MQTVPTGLHAAQEIVACQLELVIDVWALTALAKGLPRGAELKKILDRSILDREVLLQHSYKI